MRKTKIVATIGPSSEDMEMLEKLIMEGINVVRLNFSHGSHEEHLNKINKIKELNKKLDTNVAILLDTKGPEIRIGEFKDGSALLEKDCKFILTIDDIIGDEKRVSISHKGIMNDVNIGDHILLNDGQIDMVVEGITERDIECRILNTGSIKSKRGVNIPGARLTLPALTEQDKKDIEFGVREDVDYIAASFIRKASDVVHIREYIKNLGREDIKIISKIENSEGIENYKEILDASDGIMIARGDMGVEVPIYTIPAVQKDMIKQAISAGKLIITATQMLESMIENPRPTRAEVSDVANAIFDGTSAIMLSGETAVGKYPLECIEMMNNISIESENAINYWNRFKKRNIDKFAAYVDEIDKLKDEKDEMIKFKKKINFSVCSSAMFSGAKAIIAISRNGQTPSILSSFRPKCPIYVITTNEKSYRQFSLEWGVHAVYINDTFVFEEILHKGLEKLKLEGKLIKGDTVILSGGYTKDQDDDKYLTTQAMGSVIRI